ncbi:hypothetical protein PLESTM_001780800 [Pleodorina starrii]|nr:hypothetical protein PLESTM_001780800 [Pleodorina starrii]
MASATALVDTVVEETRGGAAAASGEAEPAERNDLNRDVPSTAVDPATPQPSMSGHSPEAAAPAETGSCDGCSPAPDAASAATAAAAASGRGEGGSTGQQPRPRQQAGKHRKPEPGPGPEPGSETKPKPKPKANPRLAKMEDTGALDELLAGVYDNEEELVAKLMLQLQGLSHKQQRMYGIWDDTPDGGKRAFLDQWRRRHAERRAMVAALQDPATPPSERMALRTSYILRWRKVLFSCPHCWLLPGMCVCGRMQRFAPQRTRVVVHAHHGEWGSASNSGGLLPTSLEGSEILLYGHPEHDARMRDILADPSSTTALLWPGSDSLLPAQLNAIAEEQTGGRVTVVALDATWSNARRMHGWFPKGTLTVRLPPESTLKENKLSLLRPVRKYRGDLESGRVSTVEAVASLLYELEGDEAMYRGLLENLKIKVDACRLQKNRSMVYDTHTPEPPSARHRWRREKEGLQEEGGGVSGGDSRSEGEKEAEKGEELD